MRRGSGRAPHAAHRHGHGPTVWHHAHTHARRHVRWHGSVAAEHARVLLLPRVRAWGPHMARGTHGVTRGPHRTVAGHGTGSHMRMKMVRMSGWRWGYTAVAHGAGVGSHVAWVSVRRWRRLVQLGVHPSRRVVGSRRGRRRRVGERPRGHVWLLGVHVVAWWHALHVHGTGAVQLVLGLGLRLRLSSSSCSVRPTQHPGLQLLQRQCAGWCLGRLLQHLQE